MKMSRYREPSIIELCVLIAAVLLCTISLAGCSGSQKDEPVQTKDMTGLGYVTVNPLISSGNPYEGQYKVWDNWVFDNIRTEPVAFEDGIRPDNWKVLTARVTEDGWLVPMNEKLRLHHEGIKRGDRDYWTTCPYAVQAEGILDHQIEELRIADQCKIRAEYYNHVPDWLAEAPPKFAMLMPNGDIVTYGPLGSGADEDSASADGVNSTGCCGNGDQSYYRYNGQGELIRTDSNFWWFLYFDDVTYDDPAGAIHNRGDGYVYYVDTETDEVLSVWDWDGTPLDSTVLPLYRDRHPFMALRPLSILDVYHGQQQSDNNVTD